MRVSYIKPTPDVSFAQGNFSCVPGQGAMSTGFCVLGEGTRAGPPEILTLFKPPSKNSLCGTMGLEVSLQHQDTGSIPSPAQWIKGSGVTIVMVWVTTAAQISLAQELHMLQGSQKRKKKEPPSKVLQKQVPAYPYWQPQQEKDQLPCLSPSREITGLPKEEERPQSQPVLSSA